MRTLLLLTFVGFACSATTTDKPKAGTSTKPSSASSTPYTCTKTTILGSAPTGTGVSTAPKPNPATGFKLGITGLFTNDSSHYDGFFSVVHDVNRPDDDFLVPKQFGHGAVGYWPNWPEATFLQDSATGRLSIADTVMPGMKKYWLSVGSGGANVSMRSTLAKGDAWLVCDPLRTNQSISCRPSTSKAGTKGFRWWSPPADDNVCQTNLGPPNISTQFATKQPANAGRNDATGVTCPDYAAYDVIAVEAPAPQKQQLYWMITKTNTQDTNGLYFFVDHITTGQVVWSIWSSNNDGIITFDRSFYNGTKRIIAHDPANTLTWGYGAVDYSKGPQVFAAAKPAGSQKTLSCIVDDKTSELICSVDGKVYQWLVPDIPPNKDQTPLLFGPCARASDERGADYNVTYTPARIFATEVFHFTTDLTTGYDYGG